MLKNGFLTFCCAFIPGAGQMYQGYICLLYTSDAADEARFVGSVRCV